jgi:predicted acylesterase/phospholipase RssA
MAIKKIPPTPLQKIALSCSGGGYRAASFHLGTMAYLDRVQYQGRSLLENVRLISTVSGGTITGMIYAQQKQEGKSFPAIYNFLMNKLHELDLLRLSMQKLNYARAMNNPSKRKNLINAFAELYDEHFTKGATFRVFAQMKSHLEAVVFNSTEFTTGNNFRFRNRGTGYFGNNYFRIPPEAAAEVKLADAMASSSCFPGGFEPMVWPDDFVHSEAPQLQALKTSGYTATALMDGGIYDNQGIQSILLYKKTKDDELPYFDLVIISDVASPYMTPFVPATEKPKEGFRSLTLNTVRRRITNTTLLVSLVTIGLSAIMASIPWLWNYTRSFRTGLFIGMAAAPLAVLAVYYFALFRLKQLAGYLRKTLYNRIPSFYRHKLKGLNLEELSVRRFEPLILDRLNALISLLMDVFLKVVRRLNYNDLYTRDKYEYRRIANLIRELTEEDFRTKRSTGNEPKRPEKSRLKGDYSTAIGPRINAVAEKASAFGTTLWFEEQHVVHAMLDNLVATGQFTTCYNLVDYLEKMILVPDTGFTELPAATQAQLWQLYEACWADWERFKADPMFLVKAMRSSAA